MIYDEMVAAVTRCVSVDEVKAFRDKAAACRSRAARDHDQAAVRAPGWLAAAHEAQGERQARRPAGA